MKRLVFLSLWVASVAVAQQGPSADVETVWIDPAGRGSLLVGNGQTLGQSNYRVGVSAFYTGGQLRSLSGLSSQPLLQDRLGFQVFAGVGITNWFQLAANVSVFAYQQGERTLAVSQAGLGNPWVHAKVMLLDHTRPVSLAVDVGLGIPVGTDVAQGNGGFSAAPRVQVGKVFDTFQLAGEFGLLLKPLTDYSGVSGISTDLLGSQAWLAASIAAINDGPRGEATLRLTAPLTGTGRPGAELLAGVRWPAGPVELYAVGGPGVFGEPATPSLRVYFGAAFGNEAMTQPPCVEGKPYELRDCPDLDRDGDGIKNAADRAPLEAEDKDGFQDEDGAPEADNDADGTPDADDRCPLQAGVKDNGGCPDVDQDGDGVVDRLDRCATQPEDKDDFEDSDGCPELDNDADGFADAQDACPLKAGIAQERGCPAKDSDGDQVFDHEDNCPSEAGPRENAGCPAAKKQLVVISATSLKILDKVYFDAGKASIQKRSNALLDNVALVLVGHPEITRVQVEGHTDNTGNADKNKKLSQDRADAVVKYLVSKGVAADRLTPVGFGQEKPASPNDTAQGREANRRVEFNLLK